MDIIQEVKRIMKDAQKESKQSHCLCCGKEVTSFCNSHMVPKFVLRNLTQKGMLGFYNTIVEMPGINSELGLSSAGIFKVICNQCDNSIFKDYEREDLLLSSPSTKMLAEITLKNNLKTASKRLKEIRIYEKVLEEKIAKSSSDICFVENSLIASRLDYNESIREINYSKNIIEKGLKSGYKLLWRKILDYKIPIAIQNSIILMGDLKGKRLNDKFNFDPKNILQGLEVAVFPLNRTSIIMLFAKTEHTLLTKRFLGQFLKKSEKERLAIINFMIFRYTEDYYLNPDVAYKIKELPELKKMVIDIPELVSSAFEKNSEEQALLEVNDANLPNLLSEEYKIVT